MIKIVQAVNIMISNPSKIANIIKKENEIFFMYLDKQKWSIVKRERSGSDVSYDIFYYPEGKSLEYFSQINDDQWVLENVVDFSTTDIKTREALETFKQLYATLTERLFGIDEVFEEIINSNESDDSDELKSF